MTKENRNALREKIIAAIDEMADEGNKAVMTIGGHEIARRLLYAGGSQWIGCDRDWEHVESGWAWVVDSQYRLNGPRLFGWDGNHMIERLTGYYLQDGYDEQTTPEHDGRDEIDLVPNRILLAIGKGLVAAQTAAENEAAIQNAEAAEVLEKLEHR